MRLQLFSRVRNSHLLSRTGCRRRREIRWHTFHDTQRELNFFIIVWGQTERNLDWITTIFGEEREEIVWRKICFRKSFKGFNWMWNGDNRILTLIQQNRSNFLGKLDDDANHNYHHKLMTHRIKLRRERPELFHIDTISLTFTSWVNELSIINLSICREILRIEADVVFFPAILLVVWANIGFFLHSRTFRALSRATSWLLSSVI